MTPETLRDLPMAAYTFNSNVLEPAAQLSSQHSEAREGGAPGNPSLKGALVPFLKLGIK